MKITISQLQRIIKEEVSKARRSRLYEGPARRIRGRQTRRRRPGSLSDWLADNFSSYCDEYCDDDSVDELWIAACERFGEDPNDDGDFAAEFWGWIDTHS